MTLIEQMERDKLFGLEIMRSAGLRTLNTVPMNGPQVNVMAWFSHGNQVGPVFAYLGNETAVQILWPYRIKEPRIYQQTIKKILPIIKNANHTGHIGIRTLINSVDQKAYAIRWQTTLTKEIIHAISSVLKVTFSEWTDALNEWDESNDLCDMFHYKYSGMVMDQLNDVNSKLLTMRLMGYELPINSEEKLNPVSEA